MKHFPAAALLGACALLLSGCMATHPDTLMRKQVVWLHADGSMTPACSHGWMGVKGQKFTGGKHHRRHHRKAAAKKESAPVKKEAPAKKAAPKKDYTKPEKTPLKKPAE
ncbi:MAG: hypothetical protein HY053_06955 [Proteobacteria bacterium]|nr:hypothetical protein [Pseudomonadota bacterium]